MLFPALLGALLAAPAAAYSPIFPRATPLPPQSGLAGAAIVPAAGPLASAIAGLPSAPARGSLELPATSLRPLSLGLRPAAAARAERRDLARTSALPFLRRFAEGLDAARSAPATALEAFWDSAAARAAAGEQAPELPSFLTVARKADRAFVAEAVEAANASEAGRAVLKASQALARRRGRPIRVGVRDLKGNWGEYDYVRDVIDLNSRFRGRPDVAAPTLVHELLHVLQHAEGVPSEALEMELEAHLVTLDVMRELGIEADPGTFSAEAERRLEESPEAYIAWMREQLPGKLLLIGSDLESLESDLEAEVDEARERLEARESRVAERRLDWVLHDLRLVRSADGRRRYRAFAERVLGGIRAAHAAAKARARGLRPSRD